MHAADHGTRRWRHDVPRRANVHSPGRQRAEVSRAPNLLRRPQLRRAFARDGSDPTREPPFFFQKPTDAIQLVPQGVTMDHPYPPVTKNYHYEVELVAAIGKRGSNIPADKALDYVIGYAVGLDMTRRDLQRMMGDQKKPEVGKSFDHAAVVSHLHPVANVGHLKQGAIWLKVNGETRQSANIKDMIWSVAEQIANLSQYYELFPGDIIYSGTPENVGPVVPGDVMEGHVMGCMGFG